VTTARPRPRPRARTSRDRGRCGAARGKPCRGSSPG
jgi:hypothetical protein